jgi:hypothetical protein
MMSSRSALAVATITFAGIVLPWVIWTATQAFVLGDCDTKFGCAGGVLFAAQLSALAGLLSAVAAVLVYFIVRRFSSRRSFLDARLASTLAGLCLAAVLTTIGHWPLDLLGLLGAWFMLSLALCAALLWFAL